MGGAVQASGAVAPDSERAQGEAPVTPAFLRKPVSKARLLIVLSSVYLATSFVLRLVLWAQFGISGGVPIRHLAGVLSAGAANDLVQLAYLLLPISIYLLLVPNRVFSSRFHRFALGAEVYAALLALLYLSAVEFFFFDEFDARFNLIAVNYLLYPHEVLVNIWDSYPVTLITSGIVIAAAVLARVLWPMMLGSPVRAVRFRRRFAWFSVHVGAVFLAAAWFSTDTLALWENRVTNELAANGVSSLSRAFRTNELDYRSLYRTGEPHRLLRLVAEDLARGGGELTRLADGRLDRRFLANPEGLGKRNVVVVVEESLGAEFVGAYGDGRGLTPELDALSRQGLFFKRAYATGTRTVRGLEAITASFPPIPSEAIIKRPGSEDIATWGRVMAGHGYRTSFLYGGYGTFDNLNHFYRGNGFSVIDRSDIPSPEFANIWGVSDGDLFRHALGYFDEVHSKGQPFFSILMTTSNHKPFTFPNGVPGVPPKGGGRSAGVRYADHALGAFVREAGRRAWYANTVFVVVADHGARAYGKAQIPLHTYRIPLVIVAPGGTAPAVIETPTSQLDVAPTVLGLLGLAYEAPFFGQNVLAWPAEQVRTLLFNHNHNVALLRGSDLAVLGLKADARTYRSPGESADERWDLAPQDPQLVDLATAYFQTAFDLFKSRAYR